MDAIPETRDLFYPVDPQQIERGGLNGVLIGRDLMAEIIVQESGNVIAWLNGEQWLINTSLQAFRRSLDVVGSTRDRVLGDPSSGDDAIDALETELAGIDPTALADPHSYWASIVEQLRDEQF